MKDLSIAELRKRVTVVQWVGLILLGVGSLMSWIYFISAAHGGVSSGNGLINLALLLLGLLSFASAIAVPIILSRVGFKLKPERP